MSADHPSHPPLKRLWHIAREYLTHWFTAGVILTLTGFTPDHWVERFFHTMRLPDGFSDDYRLFAVGAGVTIITGGMLARIWRGPLHSAAATPVIADTQTVAVSPRIADDTGAIKDKPSIAVLPFVNMSKDKDQEYLADGMTEDIITGLSFDSRLFVTARNSSFAYKGQTPDIRAVGKELDVRYVLEGSIRPVGERLRITVQLIDTASGNHVWADKIDRPVAEIFDIMDEVVDSLVTALCSNLGFAEAKRAARQRPEDLQAWGLCVQAETIYFSHLSGETLTAAEKLVRRALEIEPGYGAGWALLAYYVCVRVPFGLSTNLAKDADEAVSLANKALRLAPDDPMVIGYCGIVFGHAAQTTQAINCMERSLEMNPNNSLFRIYYGFALMNHGRPEDGLAQTDMFFRLSNKDPYAGVANCIYCFCYLALGDFAKAEQSAHKVIKLMPGFWWGHNFLALSLAGLGRAAEARQAMHTARQMAPLVTRQGLEGLWRLWPRLPGQAEKMIALTRQAWVD